MQDALELSEQIVKYAKLRAQGDLTEQKPLDGLTALLGKYEAGMFKRAKQYAEESNMYLDLFFHERGGRAMVEHFQKVKATE